MITKEYFNGDELAASTYLNKYALKDENGEVIEKDPSDMILRLANSFAAVEERYPMTYGEKISSLGCSLEPLTRTKIYDLMNHFKYIIPGGSVMASLGTRAYTSLSNCFVIDSPKDSYDSIMDTRKNQVQLMKRRGGVGYDLSKLRPRGARVNNSAITSTGAASFMEVNSEITREVAQQGRRGALMLSLSIEHPDSEEFILSKEDLSKITGANISVKLTDRFMRAVSADSDFIQVWPVGTDDIKDIVDSNFYNINTMDYDKLYEVTNGDTVYYMKRVYARELWSKYIKAIWSSAEPGALFESRLHNYAPDGVYDEFKAVGTNPCGEIPMGPYDSCRLIHQNLASYVINPFTEEAYIDTKLLRENSYYITRLADDLIELELDAIDRILQKLNLNYDPTIDYSWDTEYKLLSEANDEFILWWNIRKTTSRGRRAGIGFTGLADMLAQMLVDYDSESGVRLVEQVMSIMFEAQLNASIDLAIERGAFPAWKRDNEINRLGNGIPAYPACGRFLDGTNGFYDMMSFKYPHLMERMYNYGRRFISWSTVAPTGTVSLLAQTSSGIEPIFAPYYVRKRKVMKEGDRVDYTDIKGEKYTEFVVVHPMLKKWYEQTHPLRDDLTKEDWQNIYERSPYYGNTAPDISPSLRIKMQAVVQKYTTHAISSTINLPKETSEQTISDIYMTAWKEGLKGITIYRDGSREGILTTGESRLGTITKRPKVLEADLHTTTVKGQRFIVLIGLLDGLPYEVFSYRTKRSIPSHKGTITKVKKMHYSFDSDTLHIENIGDEYSESPEERGLTLTTSALLRHGVDLRQILKIVKKVDTNIVSFSSALVRILSKYIPTESTGESCPDCGGKLVREAGCIKCLDCGYSKCE